MDEWQSASTNNIVLAIIIILVVIGLVVILVAVSATSSTTNSSNTTNSNQADNIIDDEDILDEEDDNFDDEGGEAVPANPLNPFSTAPIPPARINDPVNVPTTPKICRGKCQPAVLNTLEELNSEPIDISDPVDISDPISQEIRHSFTSDSSSLSVDKSSTILEDLPLDDSDVIDLEELARHEDLASVEDYDPSFSSNPSSPRSETEIILEDPQINSSNPSKKSWESFNLDNSDMPVLPSPKFSHPETSGKSIEDDVSNPADFSSDFSSMTEESERPKKKLPPAPIHPRPNLRIPTKHNPVVTGYRKYN